MKILCFSCLIAFIFAQSACSDSPVDKAGRKSGEVKQNPPGPQVAIETEPDSEKHGQGMHRWTGRLGEGGQFTGDVLSTRGFDVEVDGRDYAATSYVGYNSITDERIKWASGVLLVPHDHNPAVVRFDPVAGITEVRVAEEGRWWRFQGRPLLLLSESGDIRLVARDIDLSEYRSRKSLKRAVEEMLKRTAGSGG